ncbi:MAG: hypothetical protein U0W40_18035 [Acidimicrobiia bacterium]
MTAKLAGILAEQEGDTLVVGLGVNVNWEAFPPELADTATACNLEAGHDIDREALLTAFLVELAAALDDPTATEQAHGDLLVTLGRRVRVSLTRGDLIEGRPSASACTASSRSAPTTARSTPSPPATWCTCPA